MASIIQPNESGVATRITTSAPQVVSPGNANLLGVIASPTATAPFFNIYFGTTATNPVVIGTCTLTFNAFTRIPAYCSGGFTVAVPNDHIDLTIFWNPTG